jgi:hypothetical protein
MRGIRAISIDPVSQSITRTDISPEARFLKVFFGEKPMVSMKLPKGDVLLTSNWEQGAAFSIGGSRPIAGMGLIVGRLGEFGERASAYISTADVARMGSLDIHRTGLARTSRPVATAVEIRLRQTSDFWTR